MTKKLLKAAGNPWGQRITLLILICIVMAIFEPIFFKAANAKSILLAISVNGIMACGMLFTVLVGGMDLSVGSMAGLAASVAFKIAEGSGFSTGSFILGCAAALAVCLLTGWLNGFFVTRFGLPAFVVTLAMKYALYGSIYMVTRGFYVYSPGNGPAFKIGNSNVLTIPMPVIIFAVCVAVCAFMLGKTTYGRRLYAIGGNVKASNLVGINSDVNIRVTYMISSVLAGLGGIILASMNGQAGQPTALNYEGNVLMAMIVGGINLAGGEGGVPGAVFGALLVGIINNVMLLLGVSSDTTKFFQGIIIIAAMSLNMYTQRRSAGLTGRPSAKSSAKSAPKDAGSPSGSE
ncbi:MAG: ABC transporter permease [Oscillospiraceae bacterium]|nr:ABC transporter permease [Oscillospiraceae bacterium]